MTAHMQSQGIGTASYFPSYRFADGSCNLTQAFVAEYEKFPMFRAGEGRHAQQDLSEFDDARETVAALSAEYHAAEHRDFVSAFGAFSPARKRLGLIGLELGVRKALGLLSIGPQSTAVPWVLFLTNCSKLGASSSARLEALVHFTMRGDQAVCLQSAEQRGCLLAVLVAVPGHLGGKGHIITKCSTPGQSYNPSTPVNPA